MSEELQNDIFTEKFLAQLYRRAAALAPNQTERNALLQFSDNATKNAEYLNHFYRQEFGTNYDPMIPEVNLQGSYQDVLNEIQKQELESFLRLRRNTYFQQDSEFKDTMRFIADIKLGHILTILSIVANME
ncbi:MAG: hypothetical protein RR585_07465 [Coprobacillus sp.]